jgi:hypothetical protein
MLTELTNKTGVNNMTKKIINLLHAEAVFVKGIHTTKRPDYRKRFERAAREIRAEINALCKAGNV